MGAASCTLFEINQRTNAELVLTYFLTFTHHLIALADTLQELVRITFIILFF